MKRLLIAIALASAPVLAHEHPSKAEQKKHAGSPTSFDQQPPVGTWATCAVSGDVFQVSRETDFATYGGRVYAFCCPDCKPDFVKDPAKYADKKPR
jgi:YHS domain-containing protein